MEDESMVEIDPRLREWLQKYNSAVAAWSMKGLTLTPEYARDGMAILTRTMISDIPKVAVVIDEKIAGAGPAVPVRVYHPEPASALPVLIYLHGGGHMTGSVAVYDPICRKIALATRHVVVSVEYRLAPEHPYPAGITDARTVVEGYADLLMRLQINFGAGLALAGDSAGGAMSATLAHAMQDLAKPPLTHLILIYPGLDYTMSHPSVDEVAAGYLLEKDKILWYFNHYFGAGVDRRAASPLFMPVRPGFPGTLLITAGLCPLLGENLAYLQKLQECGVVVRHLHLENMIHAFLNLENLVPESCRKVYAAMAEFLASEPVPPARP